MKKTIRKVLAWMLALAMVLGMMPNMGVTTVKAGGEEEPTIFSEGILTPSAVNDNEGYIPEGNYILKGDVTLTKMIIVSGETNVSIDLNGHALKANGIEHVIKIPSSGKLTLMDSSEEKTGKLTGASTTGFGAGVWLETNGTFIMKGGTITGNSARKAGGVFVGSGATFIMEDGTISENTATDDGGGVFVVGTFTMYGGTITGNQSTKGGGVYVNGGTFTMNGGAITNNTATGDGLTNGGGVYMNGGTFTMNEGTISNNTAIGDGGSDDNPKGCGGGIFLNKSSSSILNMNSGATVSNNKAAKGAGVYMADSSTTFNMKGGDIVSNEATGDAGGLYARGNFTMEGGSISQNTAGYGGGISVQNSITIKNGTISENKANQGGGIYASWWNVNMYGGSIINNTAGYGGGIYAVINGSGAKLTLGGTANISGNKNGTGEDAVANNVYLDSSKTITLGVGSNAPQEGMTVGINNAENYVFVTSGATENMADLFFADDESLMAGYVESGKLKIVKNTNIKSVQFTEPTAPVATATPASTVAGLGDNYTGTIAWSPAATTFGYSTAYTATITLTAADNYKFKSDVTIPTNWTKDATASTETSLVLTRTYDATGAAPHTHSFATAWTNDSSNHWHACTAEGNSNGCLSETDAAMAAHTYIDGKCNVCEYICTHGGITTGECSICHKNLDGGSTGGAYGGPTTFDDITLNVTGTSWYQDFMGNWCCCLDYDLQIYPTTPESNGPGGCMVVYHDPSKGEHGTHPDGHFLKTDASGNFTCSSCGATVSWGGSAHTPTVESIFEQLKNNVYSNEDGNVVVTAGDRQVFVDRNGEVGIYAEGGSDKWTMKESDKEGYDYMMYTGSNESNSLYIKLDSEGSVETVANFRDGSGAYDNAVATVVPADKMLTAANMMAKLTGTFKGTADGVTITVTGDGSKISFKNESADGTNPITGEYATLEKAFKLSDTKWVGVAKHPNVGVNCSFRIELDAEGSVSKIIWIGGTELTANAVPTVESIFDQLKNNVYTNEDGNVVVTAGDRQVFVDRNGEVGIYAEGGSDKWTMKESDKEGYDYMMYTGSNESNSLYIKLDSEGSVKTVANFRDGSGAYDNAVATVVPADKILIAANMMAKLTGTFKGTADGVTITVTGDGSKVSFENESADGTNPITGEFATLEKAFKVSDTKWVGVAKHPNAGVNCSFRIELDAEGSVSKIIWIGGTELTPGSTHNHAWNYTPEGAVITATCSASGCSTPAATATLTLTARDANYSGTAYTGASLGDTSAWTEAGLTVPTIMYVGRGDSSSYTESETAPTAIGTYTAKITVDGKIATKDFEILQKKIVASMVSFKDGEIKAENIVVKFEKDTALENDIDYTVEKSNDTIIVKGKGTYVGQVNIPIPVVVKDGEITSTVGTDESVEAFAPVMAPVAKEQAKTLLEKCIPDAAKTALAEEGSSYEARLNLQMTAVSTDTILPADLERIDTVKNTISTSATIGAYLDLSLYLNYKITANSSTYNDTVQVTEPGVEQEITLTIPEDLRAPAGKVRTYYIIRVHGDSAEKLSTQMIGTTALTFSTDKFSTYALAYTESDLTPSGGGSYGGGSYSPSVAVTGIAVKADKTTLTKIGETVQLTAEITPSNATKKKVTWTSGDEKIATVDANGKVTAVGNGTVKITATTEDGKKVADITITVNVPVNEEDNNTDDGTTTDTPSSDDKDVFTITKAQKAKNSNKLESKLKATAGDKKLSISWGKVAGADGYIVYAEYCGSDTMDKVKVIKDVTKTSCKITKINDETLKNAKNYKVYVVAYKNVDGKKVVIGKTMTTHIAGVSNKTYTNAKDIKLSKKSVSLKKGKTVTIKANTVLVDNSKKILSDGHAAEFRFTTSNKQVATVTANGKIKAVGKGTCTVYVHAINGLTKAVKITVK